MRIYYLCDQRACKKCCSTDENSCHHTDDIRHAKNFRLVGDIFVEVDYSVKGGKADGENPGEQGV